MLTLNKETNLNFVFDTGVVNLILFASGCRKLTKQIEPKELGFKIKFTEESHDTNEESHDIDEDCEDIEKLIEEGYFNQKGLYAGVNRILHHSVKS